MPKNTLKKFKKPAIAAAAANRPTAIKMPAHPQAPASADGSTSTSTDFQHERYCIGIDQPVPSPVGGDVPDSRYPRPDSYPDSYYRNIEREIGYSAERGAEHVDLLLQKSPSRWPNRGCFGLYGVFTLDGRSLAPDDVVFWLTPEAALKFIVRYGQSLPSEDSASSPEAQAGLDRTTAQLSIFRRVCNWFARFAQ